MIPKKYSIMQYYGRPFRNAYYAFMKMMGFWWCDHCHKWHSPRTIRWTPNYFSSKDYCSLYTVEIKE